MHCIINKITIIISILTNINNSIGVTTIPIKLPAAELKIAAAYNIIMDTFLKIVI